ncbi:hybrid sensor histidine kinase/response regulator transcription factor [Bacteroides sp.]
MRNFINLRFLLLLFIVSFGISQAQSGNYYYEQILLQDGLSSTVNCIYAQKDGFVWIGTSSGLGRFDGHELKKYVHSPENPNSLPHNAILHITEDSLHNVWVLTEKGVVQYRHRSDDFYLPKDQYGRVVMANTTCRTNEGILLGGRNKIYLYDYKNDSITLLHDFSSKGLFAISDISFWDAETLLCSSRWQGVVLLNLRTGETASPPFDFGNDIGKTFIDSKGRIWLAPYNGGIRCLAKDGTLLASYTAQNSKLSNNIVLCMAEREASIWMGTDGGGIDILNPETHEITVLKHISGNSSSLPSNSILSLYNDRNDNIWVGTIRQGLISVKEVSMKTYTEVPVGSNDGLSNNVVLSLYQEPSSNKIWIGTDGGGINRFDPDTEKFTHYPNTIGKKVVSITSFTPSKLLLSVYSQGLYTFDKLTGQCQPLEIRDKEVNRMLFYTGKTVNIYQYEPETLLLLGYHVFRYTIATGDIEAASKKDETEVVGTLIPVSHNGDTLYLSDLHSIYTFDNVNNKLEDIYTTEGDTLINSVSRDERGLFWIATNFGLLCYDRNRQSVQPISTSLFTNVSFVLSDHHGKVWVGADKMLFAWLVNEGKYILFGKSDGVLPNEYLAKSRLTSNRGNIYVGGGGGLLYIDKNLPIESSGSPQMRLTNVLIDGISVNSQLSDEPVGISVPWNSKAITIRVMSCEKDIFRQRLYRYQIAGLNEQCIESYDPIILIRSLPPGVYRIMAACSMKDGNWTALQQVLVLTILPPWYKTWWFTLCCVLFILGGIAGIFMIVLRRKENKLKWAMKEHEKEVYEEKVRFLINISHELRTPLTLIHAPLNRILRSLPSTDINFLPLKGIYKQSKRMKNLLDMVLELRKMEVGMNKLQISSYRMNDWIQDVAEDFISEGEAKKVNIRYQLDKRVAEVCFDKDKCEIVLTNLLNNALKHSPENTEIMIRTELLPTQYVCVSIIDQGCGLKQVDLQKLFTRFYQGNGERTGTGIGLSYSKILVELHGGKIGAKDNETVGATFFFELPLLPVSEEAVSRPKAYLNELALDMDEKKTSDKEVFNTERYSLLVVDDNQDLIDFMKEALGEKFHKVLTATDGAEALDITRKYQPDIVISDIMMPCMDGYEFCRRLKEDINISHIPVILLTARDDDASWLEGYKIGADGYLTKPFEEEMLMELIRNRLQNRERTKARYLNAGLLPPPEEVTFSQADESFLLKVNKLIAMHLENPELDVNFLSKEMCMSRATLYNKLKALTDMGGNDYINKLRLERVIQLMTTTKLNFTEIAEKTGFSSSHYFSIMFKKYTGETPTQYRKKHHTSN